MGSRLRTSGRTSSTSGRNRPTQIDRLRVQRHGDGTDSSNDRRGERIQHLGARHLVVRFQPQIFDALQVESPPSSKPKKTARAQQPLEDLVSNPGEEHTNIAEGRRTPPDELVACGAGEVQDAAQAEERGISDRGVMETTPSKDALASLSTSTGALTRSARVRWRPEPAKIFIASAGPRISVPVRTRPGTAATICRNGPLCGSAGLRHQVDQPLRGVPDVAVVDRGHDDVSDLAARQVGHQDTRGLHAETDTHDVPRRAGHVQIRGPAAAAGDLIDSAVDDEAIRPPAPPPLETPWPCSSPSTR